MTYLEIDITKGNQKWWDIAYNFIHRIANCLGSLPDPQLIFDKGINATWERKEILKQMELEQVEIHKENQSWPNTTKQSQTKIDSTEKCQPYILGKKWENGLWDQRLGSVLRFNKNCAP